METNSVQQADLDREIAEQAPVERRSRARVGYPAHVGPVGIEGLLSVAAEARVMTFDAIALGAIVGIEAPRGTFVPGAAAVLRFVDRRGPRRTLVVTRTVAERPMAREYVRVQCLTEPQDADGRDGARTNVSLRLQARLVQRASGARVAQSITVDTVNVSVTGVCVDVLNGPTLEPGDVIAVQFPDHVSGPRFAGYRIVRGDPERRARFGAIALDPATGLEFSRGCVGVVCQQRREALSAERRQRESERMMAAKTRVTTVEERARMRMYARPPGAPEEPPR